MADEWSGIPAHSQERKLILPNLSELGISKKSLAAMAELPVTFAAYFCLTGVFAFGGRDDVAAKISSLGALLSTKSRSRAVLWLWARQPVQAGPGGRGAANWKTRRNASGRGGRYESLPKMYLLPPLRTPSFPMLKLRPPSVNDMNALWHPVL